MKVQNPIIGRARGSAGGMTFCKNYDKNVARAKAFEVSNPKTQAQQTQRAFFAELTALCSDFSDDQLRTLFPSKPKTMSRRNALSKQIAQSYDVNGTEKTIDYADIDTLGNAPVIDFNGFVLNKLEETLYVNFEDFSQAHPELKDNNLMYAFINADEKRIWLVIGHTSVIDGDDSFEYPDGWSEDQEINLIPFVLNTKLNSAQSAGFGTLAVIKRPARKND